MENEELKKQVKSLDTENQSNWLLFAFILAIFGSGLGNPPSHTTINIYSDKKVEVKND